MNIKVGEFYRIKDDFTTRIAQNIAEFNVGEKVKVIGEAGKINGDAWCDIECSNKAKETIPVLWLEEIITKKEKKDKAKDDIYTLEKMLEETFGKSIASTTKKTKKKTKKEQHDTVKVDKPDKSKVLTLQYDGNKVIMIKDDKMAVVDSKLTKDTKDKVLLNLVDSIFQMCGE